MSDPHAGAILILRRTRPWLRLASSIGFILAGGAALAGIRSAIGGLSSRHLETAPLFLLTLLCSIMFLVPSMYLHRYVRRIDVFVAQGHIVQLESALEAQRRFWKFTGCCALLWLLLLLGASLAIL